ncbi:MAG TPA: DnaB-like helicase C-terminal domain-containing protein [Thermotogota bacterium]|nr:DnaB-like helicase C-terminal domain-containing protein [Thermotogota bacterium]HRW93517.1 DnaB-like helicase C-terminal domain-containing protein [Thermotogota bacterium]
MDRVEEYILSNLIFDETLRPYAFYLNPGDLAGPEARRILEYIREYPGLGGLDLGTRMVGRDIVPPNWMDYFRECGGNRMGVWMAIKDLKDANTKRACLAKLQGILPMFQDKWRSTRELGAELDQVSARLRGSEPQDFTGMPRLMDKLEHQLQELWEHPNEELRLPFCHQMIGLSGGELIAIAGRPGMGKTALMLNMARSLGKEGVPCGFLSLEMNASSLSLRLMQNQFDFPLRGNLHSFSEEEKQELKNQMEEISGLPLFFKDRFQMVFEEILGTIQLMARVEGVKVVFLDYLQLVPTEGLGQTRNDQLGAICRKLKLMAGELGVVVVVGSQLNRQVELRAEKIPFLADLRDSGAIEQDCDAVLLLYRPAYYDPDADPERLELILAKQRDGETGVQVVRYDTRHQVVYA